MSTQKSGSGGTIELAIGIGGIAVAAGGAPALIVAVGASAAAMTIGWGVSKLFSLGGGDKKQKQIPYKK